MFTGEITGISRQLFYRAGGYSSVKCFGFDQPFIEHRTGPQDTFIRQIRSCQNNAAGAHKAITPNRDRGGILAIGIQVNAVGEDLGAESGNRRKGADSDGVGAINQMSAGDGAVRADD